MCRQQEGKASADSLADLKASAAQELAEVCKQAKEQLQQSGGEAQVKLAAVQSAREALQGQVEKLQDSNGALHQQLADAHGKVRTCCRLYMHKSSWYHGKRCLCLLACQLVCLLAYVCSCICLSGHLSVPTMQCSLTCSKSKLADTSDEACRLSLKGWSQLACWSSLRALLQPSER